MYKDKDLCLLLRILDLIGNKIAHRITKSTRNK